MSRQVKVDELCINAIEDLRKRMVEKHKELYGTNHDFFFTDASKVLAAKYFQKNFGMIHMNEVMKILNGHTNRGGKRKHG